MLNYTLYDNYFTEDDPNDRLARPVEVTRRTREELIEAITGPGSILKPTETEAVINNYWDTIAEYVRQGEAYSDDYVSVRFDISGTFTDDEDRFDPNRHALIVNVRLKDSVTDAAQDVSLRKVDSDQIVPQIDRVYDWGSTTINETLTPGDVLEITGSHLKLNGTLEEEGVYFVSQSDDSEAKAEQVRTNEPKTLTLRIPGSLAAGSWRIEVRNTAYNSDTLRSGLFTTELTVE
ncbi:DUF4469 domain-containing protein [Aliifodinibius sp. S!AR15-10]|uniref:DNA-binding domain-containing protein n=1 Tax=Aliifodinibius sp. S!AR15-10 TaxID=2950437 RepID=UPI0028625CCD|nr:DNA-binding domain-containing protein [Aliifodinibius sp. S!AR15-10]MDR8394528.1 DUF4469 domain-containing protein [Aliifodinibius sp. S!AR15-10]